MSKALTFGLAAMMSAIVGLSCAPAMAAEGPAPEAVAQQMKTTYKVISPEEAKQMMGKKGVVVLDVRTPEEFAEGHIEGAVNVPLQSLKPGEKVSAAPDTKGTLLVYCRSGKRATAASEILLKSGYEKVYNFGGVQGWPFGLVK